MTVTNQQEKATQSIESQGMPWLCAVLLFLTRMAFYLALTGYAGRKALSATWHMLVYARKPLKCRLVYARFSLK